MNGTAEGDWTSRRVVSDGSYGVPEGLISSFPVTTKDGKWEIVQGLEIDEFSRARIDASVAELSRSATPCASSASSDLLILCIRSPGSARRARGSFVRGERP